MKKYIPLFLIMLITLKARSQSSYTRVLVDSLHSGVQVSRMETLSDGGIMLAGHTDAKGLLIRVDSTGGISWAKKFSGGNDNIFPDVRFSSIISSNDSGFLITGRVHDVSRSAANGMVLKVNQYGDTIWATQIIESGSRTLEIVDLVEHNNGTIATIGAIWDQPEISVSVFNSGGQLLWTRIYSLPGNYLNGYSIDMLPTGDIILVGRIQDNSFQQKGFISRLSGNGDIIWAMQYDTPDSGGSSFHDLIIKDTSIVVFGKIRNNYGLLEVGFQGSVDKAVKYNIAHGFEDKLRLKKYRGGYLMSNSDCGLGITFSADSMFNPLDNWYWMLIASDILPSRDNSFFVAGNGPMCGLKTNIYPEIGLTRVDSTGVVNECGGKDAPLSIINESLTSTTIPLQFVSATSFSGISFSITPYGMQTLNKCVDYLGTIKQASSPSLQVYPNPTSGIIHFEEIGQGAEVKIYNSAGKLIYDKGIVDPHVDISGFPKGLYFYKVQSRDSSVSGKILLE